MEKKVPPVLVFVSAVIALFWLHNSTVFGRVSGFDAIRYLSAAFCFCMSGVVALSALRAFKIAATTVNPVRPENASKLVSNGVFRYSRNPMYLGLLLLILCESLYLGNLLGLVMAWMFVMFMNRYQIVPEERALEQKFGQDYLVYKAQVRRWI